MKTEYKQTKQRIKEMKRTILTPTDLDFYNFNLEKETKNLLKRMIKTTNVESDDTRARTQSSIEKSSVSIPKIKAASIA